MKLEDKVNKNERRIKTVEEAIVLLTELTTSHSDRLEKSVFDMDELRAAQRQTDEKMNMLIDAQIKTEDGMQKLEEKMRELADITKHAHLRIDKIEEN